ncbi:MAG: site-specific DNA-methyltransferase [Pseudonocardiaceae bacterium]
MTTGVPERLETTYYRVADLKPYYRNTHLGNVTRIRGSLREHKQFKAVVVNRGTLTGRPNEVLCGSHTLLAAQDEGWEELAANTVDVDDDQAAKINLVDNPRSNHPEDLDYDDRLLLELLADLPDLEGTGYDLGDFDALERAYQSSSTRNPGLNDPDDAPADLPKQPATKKGDLWLLGPHKLAVGNAADKSVWDRLLDGVAVDCVWTDPPYGVSYVGKTAAALTIENDDLNEGALDELLRSVFTLSLSNTRAGAAWYVASPPGPLHVVFAGALRAIGVLRQTTIWVKDQFVLGHSDYHYQHEPIYYGWSPGAAHHTMPDRKQVSVFEVPRPKRSTEHPNMKPVGLIEQHITNSTRVEDMVVDPFAGSGSTLIACHSTGRVAALIELDPQYADVICRRYQEHTGIKPTRDGIAHDFTD